jgi:hypothetical protein
METMKCCSNIADLQCSFPINNVQKVIQDILCSNSLILHDEIDQIQVFQTRIAFMSWNSNQNSTELRSYLLELSIIAVNLVKFHTQHP